VEDPLDVKHMQYIECSNMLVRPNEDGNKLTLVLESKRNKRPFERGKVVTELSKKESFMIGVELKPGKFIFKYKIGNRVFIDKQKHLIKVPHRNYLFHAL